jgi:hypothetical protein
MTVISVQQQQQHSLLSQASWGRLMTVISVLILNPVIFRILQVFRGSVGLLVAISLLVVFHKLYCITIEMVCLQVLLYNLSIIYLNSSIHLFLSLKLTASMVFESRVYLHLWAFLIIYNFLIFCWQLVSQSLHIDYLIFFLDQFHSGRLSSLVFRRSWVQTSLFANFARVRLF